MFFYWNDVINKYNYNEEIYGYIYVEIYCYFYRYVDIFLPIYQNHQQAWWRIVDKTTVACDDFRKIFVVQRASHYTTAPIKECGSLYPTVVLNIDCNLTEIIYYAHTLHI